MACPTCDHTMHNVASIKHELNVYHCPRCGSVKVEDSNDPDCRAKEYRPKLVDRFVEFCGTLTEDDQKIIDNLERLGVTEAATHPGRYPFRVMDPVMTDKEPVIQAFQKFWRENRLQRMDDIDCILVSHDDFIEARDKATPPLTQPLHATIFVDGFRWEPAPPSALDGRFTILRTSVREVIKALDRK